MSNKTKSLTERGDLKTQVDWIRNVMFALVIVLFIGFAGVFVATAALLWQSFDSKQATYQNLLNQVQAQNTQIQVLTNQLKNSTVSPKQGG